MIDSYLKNQALELDRWCAATFFNCEDVTVSSLCWIVRTFGPLQQRVPLHRWQFVVLRAIGDGLERFWPGHCAAARESDLARLKVGAARLA